MELDYAAINYLRNFLPCNTFFDDLLPQYDEIFEGLGQLLIAGNKKFYIKDTEDTHELVDFLDGNGFEIIRYYSSGEGYLECHPIYPSPEPIITTTTMYIPADEDTYYEVVEKIAHTTNIEDYGPIWYDDEDKPKIIFYLRIKTNTRSPP